MVTTYVTFLVNVCTYGGSSHCVYRNLGTNRQFLWHDMDFWWTHIERCFIFLVTVPLKLLRLLFCISVITEILTRKKLMWLFKDTFNESLDINCFSETFHQMSYNTSGIFFFWVFCYAYLLSKLYHKYRKWFYLQRH